jgi:hypothetical protein
MKLILAEQMRSLAMRLNELDSTSMSTMSPMASVTNLSSDSHRDVMPADKLRGTINTRRLADLLGILDFNNFNQAIMKAKQGKANKLNRVQATEMAIAFEMLLRLDAQDTQKAMQMLKMVHAEAPKDDAEA